MTTATSAWIAWGMLATVCSAGLAWWIWRTREPIAPFPIVLATIGFYFLTRAAYLLWFAKAPVTSEGLAPAEQVRLIGLTLALGTLGVTAFVIGHSAPSARAAAQRVSFGLPNVDVRRGVWISTVAFVIGLAALVYMIRVAGGLAFTLGHQYELGALLGGKRLLFEVVRLLMVPSVLLLIDPVGRKSRWWVWIIAAAVVVLLYIPARRSHLVLAIGYPVFLYHLTVKRIQLRWMLPAGLVIASTLFTMGYLRFLRGDRLEGAVQALTRQPILALHFLNASGELKVFDAATIVTRDVPYDMSYSYGTTFLRIPWMLVPRALWVEKPATLGNVIVSRNLPHLQTGYPPTVVGEFYASAGPAAVFLGFLALGWLARLGWEWYKRRPGVGNASIYLTFCFFMLDLTRVGDPSRTVWFFLLGLAAFTVAFCVAARPAVDPGGATPPPRALLRLEA